MKKLFAMWRTWKIGQDRKARVMMSQPTKDAVVFKIYLQLEVAIAADERDDET